MLISWSDFEICAPNYFRQLWNDQDFTDVTLATVDDLQLRAHKVILSSCSPLFKHILKKNKHPNPLIYLKDLKYRDLERVLEFMYLGEVEVPEEDLQDFLVAGTELKVGGLIEDNKNYENINDKCSNIPNPNQSVDALQKSLNIKSEIKTGKTYVKQEAREGEIESEYGQLVQEFPPDIINEDKKFKCDECDYESKVRCKVNIHKRSKHEGITYDCQQCDYKATLNYNLVKHTKIKHEGLRYSCDQCDYIVKENRFLSRHKATQHDSNNIEMKKDDSTQ